MEFTEMNVICRLCLQKLTENCEPIEEIVHYTLNFLNLCLNLTISDDPMMCKTCALTLKKCFDFKMRCLSTEDSIASFAEGEDKKVDLRDIYSKVKLDGNIDRVPDYHSVCRFCLELVTDDASTSIRHDMVLITILQKYFLEVNLRKTDDILACAPCYDSLRFHVSFVNNYLSIEGLINEFCKIEGANYKDQIDLRDVVTFTSKSTLNVGNIGSLIIKDEKQEDIVNTNVDVKVKLEDPTDVEEEKEKLVSNENSFQHRASPSQTDCGLQLTSRAKPAKHKCHLCDYETKLKSTLKRHMLTHKTPLEIIMYKCDLCDYEAKWKSALKNHLPTHKTHSDMYKCNLCLYETKQKVNLKRHMLIHKTPLETIMYKCDLCDYQTKRKAYLNIHMLTHKIPSEITMYKCQMCVFETIRKDCFQRHMRVHMDVSEIMYKCALCDYQAKKKANLKQHVRTHRTHWDITIYKCDLCDYQGRRKSTLNMHMLTHKTRSEITIYKCQVCAFETKRKDCLQRHMRVHMDMSEIEMHKCKMCHFETKWKKNLQAHMVCHRNIPGVVTQATTYRCHLCNYKGIRKCNLKKHMLIHKTHLGDAMHKCNLCDYKAKRKSNLNRHMLTH